MPTGEFVRGKANQASQTAAIARVTEISDHALELHQHLQQILDSQAFRGSRRSSDFLHYIVTHALSGNFDQLKERTIGIEVFEGVANYDTGEDSIVRVGANDVRRRLLQYYSEAGEGSPYRVELPSGAYIPEFQRVLPTRPAVPPPAIGNGAAEETASSGSAGAPKASRRSRWLASLPYAVAAASLILAAWSFLAERRMENELVAAVKASPSRNRLWSELFNRDHETYVVCADSAWVLSQDLTNAPVNLSDYVNRNYGAKAPGISSDAEALLAILTERQYTNISDVRLVQAIIQLNYDYRDRSSVRSARNIQLIDFKKGNFVLLGSKRANPWVELFEPLLNFRFVYDPKARRAGFHNLAPRPGENHDYWVERNAPKQDETYSVIAFVPNLTRNGSVLMIAGATGDGTEAAGEFITHPEFSRTMLHAIGAVEADRLQYFEVLLKSGTIAGTPKNAEVVAYRLIKSGAHS